MTQIRTTKLPSFKGPFRNYQHWNGHTHPCHGMAFYVTEWMNFLENNKWTNELFEAILTIYQNPSYPIVIQCIGIYVSPKATYGILLQQCDNIMRTLDYDHVLIIVDFSMKSITHTTHYNENLSSIWPTNITFRNMYKVTQHHINPNWICVFQIKHCQLQQYGITGLIIVSLVPLQLMPENLLN